MRIRCVPSRDALDRALERPEAAFLHEGGELSPEASEARGLVQDDATSGPRHGCCDRFNIERHDRAKIDELGIDAAFLDTGNEDYRRILGRMPLYERAIRSGMPFPKTRKIVWESGQPSSLPGWALLEVV